MERLIFILFIIYMIYIIFEKLILIKNRKKLKYVIHVNGIRGKSTVCRLLDAGLRAGGYKVFTKVTGTSPRIIDTDFGEKIINRQGKANIIEQIKTINWAVRSGAEILIIECMAINPKLQYICEHKILKSDISVITNVRYDHLDVMGNELDSIAESLSNSIPRNGILFTLSDKYFDFFKKKADKLDTNICLVECNPKYIKKYEKIDFYENVAISLEICKYLGVDNDIAFNGMKTYKRDPGTLQVIKIINKANSNIFFINAMAANDPDSTKIIINRLSEKKILNNKKYLLINNRKDRINRSEQYINFVLEHKDIFSKILISGEIKNLFYNQLINNNIDKNNVLTIKDENTLDDLINNINEDLDIIAVGNIYGYGEKILNYFLEYGDIFNV
ncbi:MAG: poly-gamma-glutamate synthase PgsB [Fusobacteriaceae bacterium]|jgi:poly-gamma-glutamate synthase PgsB/CapB|nr:poly-gamma-glutamate synthase PgsB [Fusobacteriaceae bacterium]